MITFTDPFGRITIIEVLTSNYNKRIGFVIRKERQSLYESWDVTTVTALIKDLQETIDALEKDVQR